MYKIHLKKMLCLNMIAFALFVSPLPANADASYDCKENFWFTLGVDPILLSAAHMSFNYVAMPDMLITLRTAGVNDAVARTITLVGLIDGAEYTSDAGILCGWLHNKESYQFSASAGLAYVKGEKNASFFNEHSRFSTLGVPLEIQAFWKPFDHIGLGVIGFGNINSKRSFAGAVLALRISF